AEEVEQRRVEVRAARARAADRAPDATDVLLAHLTGVGAHVRPIGVERYERLGERLAQLAPGVVAVAPMPLADVDERGGHPLEVGGERGAQYLVTALARDVVPGCRVTGEAGVQVGERAETVGVDEQPADVVQKIVARGAVDRPRLRQPLARYGD